ncbi:MAG: DUF945 family protein, partial [Kangiellaceae bacterium]|nr:DUF945 family protein [Kangiellaceae bacterium]
MKKLIVLILIAVAAYAAGVIVVKSSAQAAFAQEVAQINSVPQMSATIRSQQDGVFSGSAIIDIAMEPGNQKVMSLVQQQYYGPIMFTDSGVKLGWYYMNTDIIFDDEINKELREALGDKVDVEDLFDIYFLSGFSGQVQGEFAFKGLEFTEDKTSVNISPATIIVNTDVGFVHMDGEGSWPGMTVVADNNEGMT